MGRPPRSRLQTDARRTQLLELGVALFGQRPYAEVSIDEIAEKAGISRGLLYHYFGGKRTFYLACIEIAAQQLMVALTPRPELSGPESAVAALNTYLDWVSARSGGYLALLRGGVDGEVAAILERTRAALVARMLGRLPLAGPGPHPTFAIAARAWLGAVEAAAASWLDDPSLPREQLVTLLLLNLTSSLAAAAQLDPAAGLVMDPAAAGLLRTLVEAAAGDGG